MLIGFGLATLWLSCCLNHNHFCRRLGRRRCYGPGHALYGDDGDVSGALSVRIDVLGLVHRCRPRIRCGCLEFDRCTRRGRTWPERPVREAAAGAAAVAVELRTLRRPGMP